MKTVRITAKTVDEAVEEGLKKLGLSRAEAVIRVIEQPSSGLFGLFNKKMPLSRSARQDRKRKMLRRLPGT